MKIDAIVRRETIYIAVWVGILSLLMEAVFLIIGKWDYTVLLGNLLSGAGRTCRRRPVGGCRHRNYGADGPF